MPYHYYSKLMRKSLLSVLSLALIAPISNLANAQTQPPVQTLPPTQAVAVTLNTSSNDTDISSDFLGLSYESSMLLAQNGHYAAMWNKQREAAAARAKLKEVESDPDVVPDVARAT